MSKSNLHRVFVISHNSSLAQPQFWLHIKDQGTDCLPALTTIPQLALLSLATALPLKIEAGRKAQ
jgi:hypothetical protein